MSKWADVCMICHEDVPPLDICRLVPDGERLSVDCLKVCRSCLEAWGIGYWVDQGKTPAER